MDDTLGQPMTLNVIPPMTLNIIPPMTLNVIPPMTLNVIPPMTLNVIPRLMTLNVIPRPMTLNVIPRPMRHIPSDHSCYILKSTVSNRIYIGYTVNFPRRIRQHNGELVGGAKKTTKWRPWYPICLIQGFYEASSALRFEYRLQHPNPRRRAKEDIIMFTLQSLVKLINSGDGSVEKHNKIPWPLLHITWYDSNYSIRHHKIINIY